ncbi:hypothetical protein PR048_023996 [Dryococelus australis]|uniref:Uncharacterized protein n=1 Tax=Dryococelus australis TaxID=614101 RepID=A0ABQ9GVN1_9NEOP|nr:hypothetical protein PR048_023996 [Dryococelus australis]
MYNQDGGVLCGFFINSFQVVATESALRSETATSNYQTCDEIWQRQVKKRRDGCLTGRYSGSYCTSVYEIRYRVIRPEHARVSGPFPVVPGRQIIQATLSDYRTSWRFARRETLQRLTRPQCVNTFSDYTRQKVKSKYGNRTRLERVSRKQSSDTHKTPYHRVKRCRERKINVMAPERVNRPVIRASVAPVMAFPDFRGQISYQMWWTRPIIRGGSHASFRTWPITSSFQSGQGKGREGKRGRENSTQSHRRQTNTDKGKTLFHLSGVTNGRHQRTQECRLHFPLRNSSSAICHLALRPHSANARPWWRFSPRPRSAFTTRHRVTPSLWCCSQELTWRGSARGSANVIVPNSWPLAPRSSLHLDTLTFPGTLLRSCWMLLLIVPAPAGDSRPCCDIERGTMRRNLEAAVAEWLACSPLTKAIRVPCRVSPDFRMWESRRTMPLVGGFSQGSPVSPRPFIPALPITHLDRPYSMDTQLLLEPLRPLFMQYDSGQCVMDNGALTLTLSYTLMVITVIQVEAGLLRKHVLPLCRSVGVFVRPFYPEAPTVQAQGKPPQDNACTQSSVEQTPLKR